MNICLLFNTFFFLRCAWKFRTHTFFFLIALFITLFIEFPRTIPSIASTISFLSLFTMAPLFIVKYKALQFFRLEEEEKTNSHKFRFVTSENQRFIPLSSNLYHFFQFRFVFFYFAIFARLRVALVSVIILLCDPNVEI